MNFRDISGSFFFLRNGCYIVNEATARLFVTKYFILESFLACEGIIFQNSSVFQPRVAGYVSECPQLATECALWKRYM